MLDGYSPEEIARSGEAERLGPLLDRSHRNLLAGPEGAHRHMTELFLGLSALRHVSTPASWDAITRLASLHPLRELVHLDPVTERSYRRPRGYSGDAVMLDYIYTREPVDTETGERLDLSPLASSLLQFTSGSPAAAAVRARRDLLAVMLDEVARDVARPHVLSIACGHLREAQLSRAVAARQIGRYVGFDQDLASLALVAKELGPLGIEPRCGSVRDILAGHINLGRFDFIYSTGLYDYLPGAVAARLTRILFSMLVPGGRLVIANFLPAISAVGYMECYMDWRLVFRTEEELAGCTTELPALEVASSRAWAEEHRNIAFLEVRKCGA